MKKTIGFGCFDQSLLLETEEEEVLRRKREKFADGKYYSKIDHVVRDKE